MNTVHLTDCPENAINVDVASLNTNNEKLSRSNSGLAGEYFVVAELYRRNFTVGITQGNAKAIDILAYKQGRPIAIQVKTIQSRKSGSWIITTDKVKAGVTYIFVYLNGLAAPEYFILTADETLNFIKMYKARGVLGLAELERGNFKGRWDKIVV